MQEQNRSSWEYFKTKERFADLLNGYVYHGIQEIREEDITELDPVIMRMGERGRMVCGSVNIVDLMRKVRVNCRIVLVAVQNQAESHYAMPVRVMNTDAANYYNQWKELEKAHRKAGDLKNSAEFLSGMKEGEGLNPVFTMVVYTGHEPWKGAKTLKGLLNLSGLDEAMQSMIADYPINLLEVRSWPDLEWFHSDIREVFGFLKYAEDKSKLKNYIEENRKQFSALEEDAYRFITAMSSTKELEALKPFIRTEGGKYNMCKAIEDMVQEGRQEGKQEGKQEQAMHTAYRMREKGYSDAAIAELLEVGSQVVQKWFAEANKV